MDNQTRRESQSELISFIVISGGSRPDAIQRLFDSISSQAIPQYEIIIVGENKCPFPSRGVYVERPDLARSAAICTMRNMGLDAAKGDIAILLDDDIELSPSWYEDIRAHLASNFDVAGHLVTLPNGKRWYDWNIASRTDPSTPTIMADYSYSGPDIYISGCLMIISRHVFNKVRFNEHLLNHQRDDVDFCHRVWDAGFTIAFFGKPSAIHYLEPAGRSQSDPASGHALLSEGIYLYRMGRYTEAVKLLDSVAGSGADAVKAVYHKGLCLLAMNDPAGAEACFKKTLETSGVSDKEMRRLHYTSCFHLGSIYETDGRIDEARKMYSAAITGMPEHRKAAEGIKRLTAGS